MTDHHCCDHPISTGMKVQSLSDYNSQLARINLRSVVSKEPLTVVSKDVVSKEPLTDVPEKPLIDEPFKIRITVIMLSLIMGLLGGAEVITHISEFEFCVFSGIGHLFSLLL